MQVMVYAQCAGPGLAMLHPLHWLIALPAYSAHASSGSADSPQDAQSMPAACKMHGYIDLSVRQGGSCLGSGSFLELMPADLLLERQCRDLRDAEVSVGGDEQVWHGRQSKDERLADAAESRLLGLASKPSGAVPSTQQDLEPRHHQPISYARRGDQV